MPPETSFVEHNHVVQALAPDGPDHPFNIGTLPGLAKCRKYLLDAHRLHLVSKILPKDLFAIPQHIAWRGLPRKRFAQLLHCPLCRGMGCHGEMQYASPLVRQHQEDIKDENR